MSLLPDFYPVPSPPPDEGVQTIHQIADAWIPIIIGQLQGLRDERFWQNPPDDIVPQLDQLIYQLSSEYVMPQIFPKQYTHLHINSKVSVGNAIAFLVNTGQELNGVWRQNTGALNDGFYFDILLDAGTYTVDICHSKSNAAGILHLTVTGDPSVFSLDTYAAATQLNQHTSFTFTLLTSGLKRFNGSVTSKNGSSSGYVMNITYFSIKPA